MNNNSSLSDPSLVERVFQYLYDNRGDLAKPVALVVAETDKLESCDSAQKALGGELPNSYVLSNYVTIDASTGVIDRWQFLALSPGRKCAGGDSDKSNCPDAFPLCTSLDVCGRLFEGSRDGLRTALGHILAQVSPSEKVKLAAALVETERDPLQQVQYRCGTIYASTRTFAADLLREKVVAANETGPADPANTSTGSTVKTCSSCDAKVDQLLAARRKQNKRKQQHYAILGLAALFLILALVAAIIATRKSSAKRARQRSERKLNALYQDLVDRKAQERALASLSTDSSFR